MNTQTEVDTSRWPERYACLESRMFDTLLLQTAIDPALPEHSSLPAAAWESLYRWTQRLYWLSSREPQRLMKELHQDDAYDLQCPGPSHGKPNLRRDMRKSLTAVLKLLRLLWSAAAQAALQGAEASKQFVSKFGRAKSYGEQTIGTPDAGAASMAYFFQGLARP